VLPVGGFEMRRKGVVYEPEIGGNTVLVLLQVNLFVRSNAHAFAQNHGAGAAANVHFGRKQLGQHVRHTTFLENMHDVVGRPTDYVDDVFSQQALFDLFFAERQQVNDVNVPREQFCNGAEFVEHPALVACLGGVTLINNGKTDFSARLTGEAHARSNDIFGPDPAEVKSSFMLLV